METKRYILAVLLVIVLLMLWPTFFPPQKPGTVGPTLTPTFHPEVEVVKPGEVVALTPVPVPLANVLVQGTKEDITVETADVVAVWDTEGARLKSYRLKRYDDDTGKPMELVDPSWKSFPFEVNCDDGKTAKKINETIFAATIRKNEADKGIPVIGPVRVAPGETVILDFNYADSAGEQYVKSFGFNGEGYAYLLREFSARSGGEPVTLRVSLGAGLSPMGTIDKRRLEGRYYYDGRAVFQHESLVSRKKADGKAGILSLPPNPNLVFAGVDSTYFCLIFVSKGDSSGVSFSPLELAAEGGAKPRHAYVPAIQVTRAPMVFYHGPKESRALMAVDRRLMNVIEFGRWLGFFEKGLLWILNWIHGWARNYGVAIIVLSVIIKVAFFPLTMKSYASMQKMKKLQPQFKAIQDRYKEKERSVKSIEERRELSRKKQEELMKIYQVQGMPQLGGCLPLLLQLPVLWGMLQVLGGSIELRQAPFTLWIKDLSLYDPTYVTPIIMGATMLVQQMITPSSVDPRQKRMMLMLPIMFTFFFFKFSAGLVLYWLVSNVLSIAQQVAMDKRSKGKEEAEKIAVREEKARQRDERKKVRKG